MPTKDTQLQIRISVREKADLKRRAAAAGLDVSSYVLARVFPAPDNRFADITRALADAADHRFALAALNDLLDACPPMAYAATVAHTAASQRTFANLSPFLRNYVAAMVEHAASQKDVPPPDWVRDVAPLALPWFASTLRSLRQPLLAAAPVAFKRRNIFVDATTGDRV
ncbi:MAG: plasmid mobilization protein [Gemmatimonadaceae bacterium]